MSDIQQILASPYQRTKPTYRFKVTSIQGNTVSYHDASMKTHVTELLNVNEHTLEHQYKDHMDNLFIEVNRSGEYFFSNKLSNTAIWPGVKR